MSGELSTLHTLVASVLLVVQVGCVVLVAALVARRLAGADRLVAALLGVLLAIVQAVGVCLALGMVGLLRLPAVVLAHLIVGAVVLGWEARHRLTTPEAAPRPAWGAAAIAGVGASAAYLSLSAYFALTG